MGAGDEEVLDGVFLLGLGPDEPLAAAVLGPIGGDRRPLDVAVLADRDDHRLLGDQVVHVEVAHLLAADFRAPRVGVLAASAPAGPSRMMSRMFLLVGEDAVVLGDLVQQLAVLAGELLLLQVDQLAEGHAEDGVGLHRGER